MGSLEWRSPGGAEVIPHAVRLALEADPSLVVMQLDYANAFNTVSRNLIYKQLQEHFPSLIPYFLTHYGAPTLLQERGSTELLYSLAGIHQGDPLGPFFFALALEAVRGADVAIDMLLDLAYLDDMVLCGTPAQVAARLLALQIRLRESKCGLVLKWSKCAIWSPSRTSEDCRNVMEEATNAVPWGLFQCPKKEEGVKLIGVFIGHDRFVSSQLLAQTEMLREPLTRLRKLTSLQLQILLLRFCAVPKASFRMRTAPPLLAAPSAARHDELIMQALVEMQGFWCAPLFEREWSTICHLPKREAGLGLLSAVQLSKIAFLSSVAAAAALTRSTPALLARFALIKPHLDRWLVEPKQGLPQAAKYEVLPERLPLLCQVSADLDDLLRAIQAHRAGSHANAKFAEAMIDKPQLLPRSPADLARADPKLQQRLSHLCHEMTSSALFEHLSPSAKAMRLSLKSFGASAPLDAIPSCPELTLSSGVFREFLYSYEMQHIFVFEDRARQPGAQPETCSCHSKRGSGSPPAILTLPGHVYCCTASLGLTIRHDVLFSEFAEGLRSVGVIVTTHFQQGRGDPIEPRPDLAGTNLPAPGDEALLEGTISSQNNASTLAVAAQTALATATAAERRKLAKYSDLAWKEGKHLYLLVLEASGAFGVGVQKLLRALAARADKAAFDATSESRTWAASTWHQLWTQRIACAFWRGSSIMFKKNAAAIRERSSHDGFAHNGQGGDAEDPAPRGGFIPRSTSTYYQAPPSFAQQRPQDHQHHQGASRPSAATPHPPAGPFQSKPPPSMTGGASLLSQ